MAKSSIDTQAVVKLVIDSDQAKKNVQELTATLRQHEAELRNMNKADDPKAYKEKAKRVKEYKTELEKAKRVVNETTAQLVINGQKAKLTLKELTDAQRKLNTEARNMKPSDPRYKEQLQKLQLVNRAISEQRKEMAGMSNESEKLALSWKEIAAGVVGGFGIQAGIQLMISLGRQVFETTAKFQKLEAILTTTLGSKSAAQMAMQQITDFASKTPFQVDELTDSYVKLANQGFKPTMEQMRSLGDLSASTGKDFNQLSEAIIDAAGGFEFERLKEFGIRAEKDGDKVRFTFKGITTEVDATSDSIRNYITSLGNVEGVAGSMAGISETLSGKVSNLGDAWDSLLKTVGEETEGVFSKTISLMGEATQSLTQFVKELNLAQKYNAPGTGLWERLGSFGNQAMGNTATYASIQRAAFATVSDGIDKRIADAKYAREVLDVQTDLLQRMRNVDRTTREGAAAYALYADKLKLVKDRIESIKADRLTQENIKASDAAKKAAEEEEKRKKEADRLAKQHAKEREKEIESLNKTLNKELQSLNISQLEGLDKVLQEIIDKFDPLIAQADKLGQTGLADEFRKLKATALTGATKADTEKTNAEEDGRTADDLLRLVTEMDKLGLSESDLEPQSVDAKYQWLKDAAERFGFDITEIEKYWQEERQRIIEEGAEAETEKNLEKNRKIYEADLALKQGRLQVAGSIADAMGSILEAISSNEESFLGFKKAVTLAQIAIDTASAISAVTAKNAATSMTPIDFAIKVAAAVATVMANIVAAKQVLTKAPAATKPTYQKPTYATGGILPGGPSHANGGLKLVDDFGNIHGEIEGGEPILSRETYRNNRQTIDELLYASQRRNGANISISSAQIASAERYYRNGGILQGSSGSSSTGSQSVINNNYPIKTDNRDVVEKLDTLISVAGNAWNYRVFEERKARVEAARNSQSS